MRFLQPNLWSVDEQTNLETTVVLPTWIPLGGRSLREGGTMKESESELSAVAAAIRSFETKYPISGGGGILPFLLGQ